MTLIKTSIKLPAPKTTDKITPTGYNYSANYRAIPKCKICNNIACKGYDLCYQHLPPDLRNILKQRKIQQGKNKIDRRYKEYRGLSKEQVAEMNRKAGVGESLGRVISPQSSQDIQEYKEIGKGGYLLKMDPEEFIFNEIWTLDAEDRGRCIKRVPQQRYLKEVVRLFMEEKHLLFVKSRQLMISWIMLALFLYDMLSNVGRQNYIVSKKEDDVGFARQLSLLNRVRFMIEHFQGTLSAYKGLIKYTMRPPTISLQQLGSSLYGLPQDSDAPRGDTLSNILWDEMAFLPRAEEMYNSIWHANTKGRIIGVSTPRGKRNIFYLLTHDLRDYDQTQVVYKQKERIIPGMSITTNDNSFKTVWLHYSANTEKDEKWSLERQKGIPTELWRQEMELDFSTASANRVYSGFNEEVHVGDLSPVPNKPIIRGWDFGYHHPACVFAQLVDDRLHVLKSILGKDLPINLFADQIKEFSQKTYGGYAFRDFCDPAGTHASDKGTKTSIDILRAKGIKVSYRYVPISSGIDIIRNLLIINEFPGIGPVSRFKIDRSCANLIDGFKGMYQLGSDEKPVEDGFYEHEHDCLRYIATGVLNPRTFLPYTSAPIIHQSQGTEYCYTGY